MNYDIFSDSDFADNARANTAVPTSRYRGAQDFHNFRFDAYNQSCRSQHPTSQFVSRIVTANGIQGCGIQ